ncbi:MAG: AraC family transcriptional regulator ligand-binding domain-containing protein [Halioglobus sp.]
MDTDTAPMLVSSEILLGSIEAADELGIELGPSLRRNNIPSDELRTPRGFLKFDDVVNFLNDVAREQNCPLFGFHIARHQPNPGFGPLTQLQKLCSTVGEAVEKGLRYSQAYNQASQWVKEEEGDFILLKRFHRKNQGDLLTQLHALAITLMVKATKKILPNTTGLAGVYLSHAEPDGSAMLRRYFDAPVHFDHSFNGYAVHRNVADTPIPTANTKLLAIVEASLSARIDASFESEDPVLKIEHLVRSTVGTNVCNVQGISQALSVHPRTLQRVLKSRDTSFRSILSRIRRETAEHYLLVSNISIVDLSDLLGYRNATAFIRAFKLQTGLPPTVWQRSKRR